MYHYLAVQKHHSSPDTGAYTSFGIMAFQVEEDIYREKACFDDVSLEPEAVLNLVQLCNRLQLDPLHLYDVITDNILAT